MASLWRKPVAETMTEDGNSGYQSDGLWNKYAERLDACDFFTGCGKKNGAVDFCAIAYCYWLFVNIVCDDHEPDDDERKWATHWFMYQSDSCCTSAGCEQQAQVYKNNGAWYTDPKDLVVGDQIFFQKWSDDAGRYVYYHTGGCCDWDDSYVYVTEANTSGGKTQIRKYKYSDFGGKIGGFGHPRFDGYEPESAAEPTPTPEPVPEPTPGPEPKPEPTVEKYKVTTNGGILRLRSAPNTNSMYLIGIPNGTELDVDKIVDGEMIGGDTGWCHTSYGGYTGYVAHHWVTHI